jgi:hypothetical protein
MSKGPLFALRAGANGVISPDEKNGRFNYCDWLEKKAGPGMASPVSTGSLVIVVDNNILRAYEASSGRKVTERRLDQMKTIAASPILVGNKLLVLDEQGNCAILDCSIVELPIVGRGKLEDTFWSTPAVANNALFLRGIDILY